MDPSMSQVNAQRSLVSSSVRPSHQAFQISRLSPYLFLLPGMILFALFIVWPMLYSLRISFYQWNSVHPDLSVGVGLKNYADALSDPIFQRSVLNTLAYG